MSWKYKDVCELLSCMWFCWSVEYSDILIWWIPLLFFFPLWRTTVFGDLPLPYTIHSPLSHIFLRSSFNLSCLIAETQGVTSVDCGMR